MYTKYKKIIGWSLVNQAITKLVGFLSVLIINQLFSKELYGEMVFFSSIFTYILIIATLGFDKTIVFKLSHYSEAKVNLFGKNLVIFFQKYSFLILAIVEFVFISAWYLFFQKDLSNEWFWIFLLSINAFPTVTITLYTAYFQANKFADTTIKINITRQVTKLLILVSLFYLKIDSLVYFAIYILLPTTISIVQFIVIDKRSSETGEHKTGKPTNEEIYYSIKMMFTKFAHQGVEKIDLIVVGAFLSASFVAEYAIAAKLALLILIGNNLLGPLFSPRLKFAINNKSDSEVSKEYNYNKYFSTGVGFLLLLLFFAFGKFILSIFGDYEQSYGLLILLGLAFLNKLAIGPGGRLLALLGYANFTMIINIICLFFMVTLNLILIPSFGLMGAAFGTYFSLLILNAIILIFIKIKASYSLNSSKWLALIIVFNLIIFAGVLNL